MGSICSISNGHVASALGAPVLLIGKPGVGDAVDSFNLNSTYMQAFGATVLGAVFNKLPVEGFYNVHACKDAVESYFSQYQPQCRAYGFVPIVSPLPAPPPAALPSISSDEGGALTSDSGVSFDSDGLGEEDSFRRAFAEHVDWGQLLFDIWHHQVAHRDLTLILQLRALIVLVGSIIIDVNVSLYTVYIIFANYFYVSLVFCTCS